MDAEGAKTLNTHGRLTPLLSNASLGLRWPGGLINFQPIFPPSVMLDATVRALLHLITPLSAIKPRAFLSDLPLGRPCPQVDSNCWRVYPKGRPPVQVPSGKHTLGFVCVALTRIPILRAQSRCRSLPTGVTFRSTVPGTDLGVPWRIFPQLKRATFLDGEVGRRSARSGREREPPR